jgi:hypothetical protein
MTSREDEGAEDSNPETARLQGVRNPPHLASTSDYGYTADPRWAPATPRVDTISRHEPCHA